MKIFQVGVSQSSLSRLSSEGAQIVTAAVEDLQDLADGVDSEGCDLLVLHGESCPWMYASLAQLRRKGLSIPIIGIDSDGFMSWPEKRASFLDNGGDDLVQSPGNSLELAASARALLRRANGRASDVRELRYRDARLVVDFRARTVSLNGYRLECTCMELQLLLCLAENAGATCERQLIHEKMYREAIEPEANTLEVFLVRLRKKFEAVAPGSSAMITTMRGFGYKLEIDEPEDPRPK